jgi:hypothetical protein
LGIQCTDDFYSDLTTPGFKKGLAFDKLTDIDSEDGVSEANGNTPRATMTMQGSNPPSALGARPPYVDAGSGALSSLGQADIEKPMPPLPPLATSVPEPQTNTPNRPVHARKISSNILPSLSVDSSPDSQSNAVPYLPTGGSVIRAAEEANGRRRAPPLGGTMGLPPRPRLTISGPKAPPQDGKGDQAPSAFERPRPPPLILQQPNRKPPGIGGSF